MPDFKRKMKCIIVGGVAGGATAAARARRLSENAEIVLLERGFYVSYANCGLPYYIGEIIEKRDDLFIASPEQLRKRYRIDVKTSQEVLDIDRDRKEIRVKSHATGEVFNERYDKLLLSPGSHPIKPPLPGVNSKKIFTMGDLPDSDSIKACLERNHAKSVLVAGGGSIGMEAVENFARLGIAVTVIEKQNQIMPPLDYEMAAIIHHHLREQDIRIHLGDGIASFTERDGRLLVTTDKDVDFETDIVLLSIGIKPENELAKTAGLTMGEQEGVMVDEGLRTSDPDIYAIGDVAEAMDLISGKTRLLALAGPANKQGRVAADNIMGRESKYEYELGTSITKVFQMAAASTGDKEDFLKQVGKPFQTSFTHSYHHASYYPGAKLMAIKLIFDRERGGIFGAQIVGEKGVDKRIDVISTAMRAGMTVYDLEKLELAYAPQFGAAKDPVNIAGYVASNILKGDVAIVHWHELCDLDKNEYQLLDVRTKDEVKSIGPIPDAVHIHIDELRDRLEELDKRKIHIAYCTVSLRGYIAFRILVQNGFKAAILSGGLETWTPPTEDMAVMNRP